MSDNQPKRPPRPATVKRTGKLALAFGGLIVCGVAGVVFLRSGPAAGPKSTPLLQPHLGDVAGGTDHSPKMDKTVSKQEQASAEQAQKTGTSYASEITTGLPKNVSPEIGDTPTGKKLKKQDKPAPDTTADKPACGNPFTLDPGQPGCQNGTHPPPQTTQTTQSTQTTQVSEPDTGLPATVEAELLQAWSPAPPALDLQIKKDSSGNSANGASGSGAFAQAPPTLMATSGAVPGAAPATTSGSSAAPASPSRRLLLPAGRGVYGHAVLEANSDIGGPVLVQLDSGPLVGDRVSGTFQRKDDRLVIKFDKLMIGTSDPVSVDAYATSPDTGETGVASEVDEHYFTRIVLPAAAAFVQGLGTAIQTGNSTTVSNGLSTNAYSNLSLAQEAGIGAGAAAQQLGQILQKATPQEPTVILKRNDPVGVVFAQPVYAP